MIIVRIGFAQDGKREGSIAFSSGVRSFLTFKRDRESEIQSRPMEIEVELSRVRHTDASFSSNNGLSKENKGEGDLVVADDLEAARK